jgi:hypothetical protein
MVYGPLRIAANAKPVHGVVAGLQDRAPAALLRRGGAFHMQSTAIFWPMIVQIALTIAAYAIMSARRIAAVKSGEARARDFRIPSDPESSASAARNVSSQFELPVLFYVVCLAFQQTGGADLVALVLAWLFVAARIAHAWVHMTSNIVLMRRRLFILGFVIVIAMWGWFAIRIMLAGGGAIQV